ncbi:MAG: hypothetical protein ABI430_00305 [Candidatus Taylorbacteria bacterium]
MKKKLPKEKYTTDEVKRYIGAVSEDFRDQVKGISEQFTGLNLKIDKIQGTVDSHTEIIGELKVDVTILKEDMSVLKEDVGVLKKDVGVLKEDVGILKEDVGVLKKDVGVLKEDVGILKEDVGVLKEDVGVLKGDMKIVKKDIGEIKTTLPKKANAEYVVSIEKKVALLEQKN